jgi:hypothetical protein
MNRTTLESAITMGLKRAQARSLPPAPCIADAIEMAMELERSLTPQVNGKSTQVVEMEPEEVVLPPNPRAVLDTLSTQMDPTLSPPARDPDLSPDPKSVVIADEAALVREINAPKKQPNGLRVKSLYVGGKLRVGMEDLAKWANHSFPRTIRIVPRDVDHEIELELQVKIFPMTGDGRNYEKESTIKVVYKHPSVGSDLEAGVPIRVADFQDGFPDVPELLGRIKAQAVELYRQRPKYIEGRAPAGPGLMDQHRLIRSNTQNKPKGGGASITFIDDDDMSLSRPG